MPSLNRHEKVSRFMEFSANGKKSIENFFTHKLFVIVLNCNATVKLLQFLTFISDPSVLNELYSNYLLKSTRECYSFHVIFRKW